MKIKLLGFLSVFLLAGFAQAQFIGWQCVAVNRYMYSFYYVAPTLNQAAYGALYMCGGPYYQVNGCYVPPGYCQYGYGY